MSHDDHAPVPGYPVDPVQPEPSGAETRADRTPPPAAPPKQATPATSDDGILRPIQESDYFTLDPTAIGVISANIDRYFNQALDIFPFWRPRTSRTGSTSCSTARSRNVSPSTPTSGAASTAMAGACSMRSASTSSPNA